MEPSDNPPTGQEPPKRPPQPPLPSQQLPETAEPSIAIEIDPPQTRITHQTPPRSVSKVDISGTSTSTTTSIRQPPCRGISGMMAPIRENRFMERETSLTALGRQRQRGFMNPSRRELDFYSLSLPPREMNILIPSWRQLDFFYPSRAGQPDIAKDVPPDVLLSLAHRGTPRTNPLRTLPSAMSIQNPEALQDSSVGSRVSKVKSTLVELAKVAAVMGSSLLFAFGFALLIHYLAPGTDDGHGTYNKRE